jgi:hypothetical protein
MPLHDGARQESKRLATIAGKTTAQAVALSGADLMQAAAVVQSGLAVGAGNDGAKMELNKGGSGA